jgi:aspartyl-tRNA(Asn)/glutamyl-tRNA(Gln) amidotransferase subunit B
VSRPWEAVIGLEVHAQLRTETKIFCGCATRFGREPNSQTCPVCTGLPGVLPVLNRQAAEYALRAGLALNCRIPPRSVFARKNYFYPDLPKGYQISQFEHPVCGAGWLEIGPADAPRRIGLTRAHLEEDAGKLIHGRNLGDPDSSYVDLNRAGTPLLEIVTDPDLRTPEEARDFLMAMRRILLFIGICDGNMEEGSLRCDANVSLRPAGEARFGTKTEIKNMNSFRNVQRALAYEIWRQEDLLERGERVVQETRLYDPDRDETFSMRGKEEAHDYRYFPEPDLVPLEVTASWLEEVRAGLPELPQAVRERFVTLHGLPAYDADVLTQTPSLARYFQEAAAVFPQPKKVSNWIMTELLARLKEGGLEVDDSPVAAPALAGLLALVEEGAISGKMAKEVFGEMFATGREAREIVAARGLSQVADQRAIGALVDRVLAENPAELAAYRGGKEKLFGFFVGQVMRLSAGKASPGMVNEILRKKLG